MPLHSPLTGQFCVEMLRFQSRYFQQKDGTPGFFGKRFTFFRKFVLKSKYWKPSEFPVIVTKKHVDLSNGGLFWKPQKTNSKFAVKLAERSNRSFSVYLINHLFQKSVLFNMWQWNVKTLTDCVNIWKRWEVAKLLIQ